MTSNGYLLGRQAVALAGAGLQSINVSLDAMDEVSVFIKWRNAGIWIGF